MNNKIFFLFLTLGLLFASCKKDNPQVSEEELNVTAEGATLISTGVQSFVLSAMTEAGSQGFDESVPSIDDEKKNAGLKAGYDYSWSGPDGDGWYTRSMSGVYDYYEKIRFRDTIDYIMVISYSGADGSYENKTTTQFIKYKKNNKELFKGFSRWELHTSGYNDMSRVEWKINFEDWNAENCAGIYDWYWGVSENSGGNTVPYHRFEHMVATETTNDWLHCRVQFYDEGNTEIWDFEYDTPCVPVYVPELPDIN